MIHYFGLVPVSWRAGYGSPEGPKGMPAADAFGIMSFII